VDAQRSVVHKLGTADFCVCVKKDDRQVEALYAMPDNKTPKQENGRFNIIHF